MLPDVQITAPRPISEALTPEERIKIPEGFTDEDFEVLCLMLQEYREVIDDIFYIATRNDDEEILDILYDSDIELPE